MKMPIYNFQCECGVTYEELTSFDETDEYPTVSCPECQSTTKDKLISVPSSAIFANPEGTDKWNNSHSYRFGHKFEEAQALRRNAESRSHVGRNPYKDDPTAGNADIESGKYFGEVK
jgi:putative FmdB family regulatory protein